MPLAINSLTVALKPNMSSSEAEQLSTAIKMLKGVVDVGTNVDDHMTFAIDRRVRAYYAKKLFEVVKL